MTSPSPPTLDTPMPDPHAPARRATTLAVGAVVILIALKAFALGASGSVAVLASLTESMLVLVTAVTAYFAARRGSAPETPRARRTRDATAGLVQSGLMMASAAFVGWTAIQRIFVPWLVGGGFWALGVMALALALGVALAWYPTRTLKGPAIDRGPLWTELGVAAVVLIGLVSGAFLSAPGLDAAAGLVLAVWLFWGGASLLKTSRDRLSRTDAATDPSTPDIDDEPHPVGTSVPPT